MKKKPLKISKMLNQWQNNDIQSLLQYLFLVSINYQFYFALVAHSSFFFWQPFCCWDLTCYVETLKLCSKHSDFSEWLALTSDVDQPQLYYRLSVNLLKITTFEFMNNRSTCNDTNKMLTLPIPSAVLRFPLILSILSF